MASTWVWDSEYIWSLMICLLSLSSAALMRCWLSPSRDGHEYCWSLMRFLHSMKDLWYGTWSLEKVINDMPCFFKCRWLLVMQCCCPLLKEFIFSCLQTCVPFVTFFMWDFICSFQKCTQAMPEEICELHEAGRQCYFPLHNSFDKTTHSAVVIAEWEGHIY